MADENRALVAAREIRILKPESWLRVGRVRREAHKAPYGRPLDHPQLYNLVDVSPEPAPLFCRLQGLGVTPHPTPTPLTPESP